MSRNAVILAGGLGMRLRPFTEVIPKPLLPIGEKAVLEIQIEHLKRHGITNVILATNYKSEYIKNFFGDGSRYGVHLMISKEETPLGTAGPIRLLKDNLTSPFAVMNGDILSSIDLTKMFEFANSQESLLTVGIKKIVTPYHFGNIHFQGDLVTNIEEKPDIITYALAGIYIMKPEIIDLIPPDEYFGMDHLMKKMLNAKMPITKYDINEYWLDIGRIEDYDNAQQIYQDNFKSQE